MISLAVLHLSEGGNVYIEDDGGEKLEYENDDGSIELLSMWEWYVKEMGGIENITETSVVEGVEELRKYWKKDGGGLKNDDSLFEQKVVEFLKEISDKKGKFYSWEVEYDRDLIFIED